MILAVESHPVKRMEEARRMRRLVFGLALFLLMGLSVSGWAVEYPLTVSDIAIEGTAEIKDKDVLEVVDFAVGEEIYESDLRAASQAIFDLGWFSEVLPDVGEDGTIVFDVVEYPVVRDIVITGNVNRRTYSLFGIRLFSLPIVPKSKIQQILYQEGIRKRKVLNRPALETALNNVLTEYSDRGYVLVALGDVTIGETLEIEIVEALIAANRVTGLDTVPNEVALELIDVPLDEPLHMNAANVVVARLNQSVYFTNVEVVPQAGPDRNSVILEWHLEERRLIHDDVQLSAIAFEGVTCYEEETVREKLGEIPNAAMDNYGLLRVLEGVYDLYTDAGYMMTRLVAEELDGGTLTVRVDEGRVSEIRVEGMEHTQEYVIRRKLDIEVGRILTRSDYRVSYQNLSSLGYFGSVSIAPEWGEDGVVVTVTVRDSKQLGGFEGSMALDPRTGGLVGELKVRQKNLLGTGQDVSLSYSRGLALEDEPSAVTWDLGYTSVAFFPEFDRVGLDLYQTTEEITDEEGEGEEDENTSTILTYGVGTSFAYPVMDYVDLSLAYKHEEERTVGETNWTPTDSVTISVRYDDVTDLAFPTGGARRLFSLEKAGGFSAGREYMNLLLNWAQYTAVELPFFGDMRQAVGVRFRVGWGDDRLPASQRYELGGSTSVRGKDSTSVKRMLLTNAEYRVELAEDGLYFTTFFDAGFDLDTVRLDSVLSTAGIEFAVNAGGIYVRLDVAWSLGSDWSWIPKFDIGFGPMF
jgi:outer membrane protein insertion porin family